MLVPSKLCVLEWVVTSCNGWKQVWSTDRHYSHWLVSRRWVWVGSGSWWWTGKPGVLQSMGLQRVRHDRATVLKWKSALSTCGSNWSELSVMLISPTWWGKTAQRYCLVYPLRGNHNTSPTKVHLVKTMVFPVVIYGCESWTVKKAEHRRTDAFEMWCWRRPLRVPWTARSNQSILKEISPGCSLEGLMLKLKLQYFGHLMQRVDSLEKTLMLGRIGDR